MKRFGLRRTIILLLLTLLGSRETSLYGWNDTGHKAIMLVAYQRLTPRVRQRVDQLLAKHPDYAKWVEGVPVERRSRAALLAASVWPDSLRQDPRFHDTDAPATPPIPGLPEGAQARHNEWHSIYQPFSTDGTPTVPAREPNALIQLKALDGIGRMPEPMQVYLLPWLLHLVADVHNPIHTMNRFTAEFPKGDRVGLDLHIQDGTLHLFWDALIGTDSSDRSLDEIAAKIQRESKPAVLDVNPERWVNEGFSLRGQVYDFSGPGTEQKPAVLTEAYSAEAHKIAFQRAVLASYRLAEFLNTRF